MKSTTAKTPTAQLKAERAARKKERLEKKARDAAELADLRECAKTLTSRMPPEFQDWGSIKTRAYSRLMAVTVRRAALKRPKLPVLRECVHKLQSHAEWKIEDLMKLASMPETATQLP